MQTFLPYPDFTNSLRTLDRSRLGNQVYREGLTLLRGGWRNHPASKMWRGYSAALAWYCWCGLDVLKERGLNYDHHYLELLKYLPTDRWGFIISKRIPMPAWLGDKQFHASHRSNLLRKDPLWYGQFGWEESNDLPYVWPVK